MKYSNYQTVLFCLLLITRVSLAINHNNTHYLPSNILSIFDNSNTKDLTSNILQLLNVFGELNIKKEWIINLLPVLTFFDPDVYPYMASLVNTYKSVLENEDRYLDTSGLLKKYGYKVEEHETKTSDDYLLTMFRIPRNGSSVLLIHGGTSSSDDFVTPGPGAGLAYVLADAGYDVWLGNNRGNKYSNRHTTFTPAQAIFWNFSFDENGRYDVAAMIDYILNKTNETQVKLVAHSQGTTSFLVLCSERPEYNNKISVTALLSAIAHGKNTKSPIFRLLAGPWSPLLISFAESIGMHSIFASPEIVSLLTTFFCGTPELATAYCNSFFYILIGPYFNLFNVTSLPVIYSHLPSAASLKQLKHSSQLITSGIFRQYDYGTSRNFRKYGSPTPPDYLLEKITTKVTLFYSDSDIISVKEDIEDIKKRLPNVIESYRVPLTEFAHLDYLFAKNAKKLVYDKLLEILDSN